MDRHYKTAAIFGGTGFIGSQAVRLLAKQGFIVKVAARVPERAYDLKPCGHVGQVVPLACDYSDPAAIRAAVAGSDCVINCTGILFERGRTTFDAIHATLPRVIAEACRETGAARFVHISALGAEQGTSRYARSKKAGEEAARASFPAVTILRPSVVFGPDDDFFNKFAHMARFLPALPLIGGGHTKFQPVYVGDVARAVMAALTQPGAAGRTYELGGPDIVDFRRIYEMLFEMTGRRRHLVTLPWGLAKIDGAILSLLPKPPLTADQVESLKTDTVVSNGAAGLQDLGIAPTSMAQILPGYLEHYRAGGKFGAEGKAFPS